MEPVTTTEGVETIIHPAPSEIKEENKLYIEKTTAAERLTITRSLDHVFDTLDGAHHLIEEIQTAFFGDFEQKPIEAHDAKGIAVKLEIIGEIVFDALLAYSLTIGRGDFRGVAPYLESAERSALAVKVKRQLDTAFPGIERAERRKEIMGLSDEQAAAILEKEEMTV